jgi:hypothetical protein
MIAPHLETLVGFMPEKQILAKVEKHISAEASAAE